MYGHYHITLPIKFNYFIMRVTRGSELTPMQKMAKPFDFPTWTVITVTFLSGFLFIFIVNFMPKFIQKFVFGTHVHDPTMGMVQIFFGIGLVRAPGRNFSRFMFILFTILCLIIRTAYQSKMFDFMLYDDRQPAATSIQEIVDLQMPVELEVSGFFDYDDESFEELW